MTPTEIIVADAIERDLDPYEVVAIVSEMLKTEQAIMMKKNDSVLLLEKIVPGDVALHLFTEDQPMTLVKSVKFFIDKIRASDIRAVYANADNDQIVKLLVSLGVPVQNSDDPNYNFMAIV